MDSASKFSASALSAARANPVAASILVDTLTDVVIGGTHPLRAVLESAGTELSWSYAVGPLLGGYLPSYGRLGDAAVKTGYAVAYTTLVRRLTGSKLNLRTAAAIAAASLATNYAVDA